MHQYSQHGVYVVCQCLHCATHTHTHVGGKYGGKMLAGKAVCLAAWKTAVWSIGFDVTAE